ncbi:hypothetical protein VIGAN_01305200 [Vigna angularis var. angularis]|uniref:Pentacotripeptide-repeat region of PRORP domain-containing protein n=1 Tax=Vigna angularis var. angularis TaxID=157739 RepID=A0A0S3R3U4_PHAAN|nr:hypothetical protein VIGAN_01305200 [Vigna angularis var. angularis]
MLWVMLDLKLQPTIVAFNVLMIGFCLSGMVEDGERVTKWIFKKGTRPNATTFNFLLKQYYIRNNMCVITEIYKKMYAQGVIPDNNSYNILIKGRCKGRNMKDAWFLHKEMVETGFSLTATSYNALIKAFCKKKIFVEAKKLFEMRTQGFVAKKEIYDIYVDANYEERKWENTVELCDEAIVKCLLKRT